jgi:flagellar export protein FliJ
VNSWQSCVQYLKCPSFPDLFQYVTEDSAMPRQKYRLRPVLDVRQKAKQAAAKLLAARRAQLAEAEAELVRRNTAVDSCRAQQVTAQEKMLEEVTRGLAAHGLVVHRTHLADLRRIEQELVAEVEVQRRTVAAAEAEVDKAVTALIEASKEVQVIEKHHDTWQQSTRREEQRREQKIGDEIGAITHRRGRVE